MAKKPTRTVATIAPVVLPAGYNSPAFQTPDGLTLFVGRWQTFDRWAVLTLIAGAPQRLNDPLTPVASAKIDAKRNLISYAAANNLRKVQ